MKKKVFISVYQIRDIGGITPSFLNLLNVIANLYDVTVCVLGYCSPNKQIPSNVKVLNGSSWYYDCCVPLSDVTYPNVFLRIRGYFRRIMKKIFGLEFVMQQMAKELKHDVQYDAAIAYANNIYNTKGMVVSAGDYDAVLRGINAKRKIAWLHNDPFKVGFTHEICLNVFKDYDAVVCVSKDNKRLLDSICPEYANKSYAVYNMFDLQRIKDMSVSEKNPYVGSNKSIHFVTVARLDNSQKRIDRIVAVCSRLLKEGYDNFDWTLVGKGNDRETIENTIKKEGISNLHLVGLKYNPYPYVLHASASVLTSLYEGYSMTVKEAQVLGTPTIITNYDSAYEAVTNGCEGVICENSTEGVYKAIKTILEKPEILQTYRNNLREHPVTNEVALQQFKEVIGN